MKQSWSRSWISSKQPRKQRKYRHQAPLQVRHRFLAAHLTPALRETFMRRSIPLRKGDEIKVMRGKNKGAKGEIDTIDLKKVKVYIDSIKVKKADGSEVHIPFSPSNLMITKLNMDDPRRKGIVQRKLKKEPKKHVKTRKELKEGKKPESSAPKEVKKQESKEEPKEKKPEENPVPKENRKETK